MTMASLPLSSICDGAHAELGGHFIRWGHVVFRRQVIDFLQRFQGFGRAAE